MDERNPECNGKDDLMDNGWIEKNGDYELEDVSDIKKPVHMYTTSFGHIL